MQILGVAEEKTSSEQISSLDGQLTHETRRDDRKRPIENVLHQRELQALTSKKKQHKQTMINVNYKH